MRYCLSVPTKGVALGTAIRVDFKFIPLVKGLKIETVASELIEIRHLEHARSYKHHRIERVIVRKDWKIPNDFETVDIDGQDGYRFDGFIQTPKSLTSCVQSVETRGIEVKHMVKSTVHVRSSDGLISQVRMPPTSLTFLRHLAYERRCM